MFAIQVRIIGSFLADVVKNVLFTNKAIHLPETIAKVDKSMTPLLQTPVMLDIGQYIQVNDQLVFQALLKEMTRPPSLRSVQESIGAQTASTFLRELSNCSFWRSFTESEHCASCCEQQPSDLMKVLDNSSITTEEVSTPVIVNPLRTLYHHLETMTQIYKARECEMMYALILTLPKITCAQRKPSSPHLDQDTTADTLTSWYIQDLLVVIEDIEEYQIQIPNPMTVPWNAPFFFFFTNIASPCVNSNPRCPSKGV
jgi:hypothetical protein